MKDIHLIARKHHTVLMAQHCFAFTKQTNQRKHNRARRHLKTRESLKTLSITEETTFDNMQFIEHWTCRLAPIPRVAFKYVYIKLALCPRGIHASPQLASYLSLSWQWYSCAKWPRSWGTTTCQQVRLLIESLNSPDHLGM